MHGSAPSRTAGFAHAQMVVEQGARAHIRERLKICRTLLEQGKSSCGFAFSDMPRGIISGSECEQ